MHISIIVDKKARAYIYDVGDWDFEWCVVILDYIFRDSIHPRRQTTLQAFNYFDKYFRTSLTRMRERQYLMMGRE